MSEDKLAAEVDRTAAVVADWRNKIAGLETTAVELGQIISKATAAREGRALSSLLGDAAAKAAITSARAQQREAEEELADIVRYGMPSAQEALAEAETAAKSAHAALSHYHTGILKRERIGVTKELDHVLSAMVLPLILRLDDLGEAIANATPQAPSMFGTSNIGQLAEIVGDRRLRAAIAFAMGTRIERIYRTGYDEMKAETLASSESRVWSLPPDQSEKAA
jgi:hypothetical protein